jgi:AcrR family transcriptional regulator
MAEAAFRRDIEEPSERRTQILNAAERSFTRAGFHRATMHDVAAEAGMSPGNLYRYFSSKDALVAGLCERDRAELAEEFSNVEAHGGDFLAMLKHIGRKYFEDDSPQKARLCLEIWSEATRNPHVAALQTEFDRQMTDQLIGLFDGAKRSGAIPHTVNSRAAASILDKLAAGLFVRKASATDFDPEREIGEVFAVVEALLNGSVRFPDQGSDSEKQS